jgi:hypothetical protein
MIRSRRITASLLAALIIAGCGGTPAQDTTAAPPRGTVPTPSPTIAPTPTTLDTLDIDSLPGVALVDALPTAVCDPEPGQADPEAGEGTLYCGGALELALGALRTVTGQTVERLYLDLPACATSPCTEEELDTGTVTAWTATSAWQVVLDTRSDTVTVPIRVTAATWPQAGTSPAPSVKRPVIQGAPAEVASRTPLPYCGRAEVGAPPEVAGCFRDAVLAGRRAEMIERVHGTEGGEILWIDRFDGAGPIVRYVRDRTSGSAIWHRSEGTMILGTTELTWDFDPWDRSEVRLKAG